MVLHLDLVSFGFILVRAFPASSGFFGVFCVFGFACVEVQFVGGLIMMARLFFELRSINSVLCLCRR